METVTIKAALLFEFTSFQHWVNNASSWFKPYKYGYSYICLDANNDVCHIGEDFMKADKEDLFPIKVYALQRTSKPLLTNTPN